MKPCPFCGSHPDVFEDGEIQCSNKKCPVRPSARWGGVEVWNTRISPASAAPVVDDAPIDMVLFCPRCGTQHVDAPEGDTSFRHRMEAFGLVAEPQDSFPTRWTNPPHKSHLCHNCFAVWRPADVPTNGVAHIKTRGKEDNTWTNSAAVPAAATAAPVEQYYCPKHKYNPPPNSVFALCPKCEIAAMPSSTSARAAAEEISSWFGLKFQETSLGQAAHIIQRHCFPAAESEAQ